MNKGAAKLYKKLILRNYTPNFVCEVGVYLPEESNVLNFIKENIPTILVEADPIYANNIRNYFKYNKNVSIIEAAIYDFNGQVELSRRQASTFISELKASPALINDNYIISEQDKFTVDCILFSEIDKGNIDLLSIDIEGAEWYVIKHLKSRPDIISIETHGKYYTNPKINEIKNWMRENNYFIWYKDKSDTIFVKNGIFRISMSEKVHLNYINLIIWISKQKRILKKMSRS